jgi:hypothetical protein
MNVTPRERARFGPMPQRLCRRIGCNQFEDIGFAVDRALKCSTQQLEQIVRIESRHRIPISHYAASQRRPGHVRRAISASAVEAITNIDHRLLDVRF